MLGSGVRAINVTAQKPLKCSTCTMQAWHQNIDSPSLAARSSELAFVADSHHGREEPVVGDFMMEYNGPLGIFSRSRSEIKMKIIFWMPNKAKIWDSGRVRPCTFHSSKRNTSMESWMILLFY